jgi:hypothetical protein
MIKIHKNISKQIVIVTNILSVIYFLFDIKPSKANESYDSNFRVSEFNTLASDVKPSNKSISIHIPNIQSNAENTQSLIKPANNFNIESRTQLSLNTIMGNDSTYGFASAQNTKLPKSVVSIRIEPKIKLKFNDINTTAVFNANIASSSNIGSQNLRQAIREAYVRYSSPTFDISLGRQLFNYGKTDILTIQDQFAPRDITWQGDIYQKSQLGQIALKSEFYLNDNLSFTNAIIMQDNGYTLPNQVVQQLNLFGYYTLGKKPELAGLLRFDYRKDNIELGIMLSKGVNPMPAINTKKFVIDYIPELRLAVDGSYAFNQAIWRYDINYAQSQANKEEFLGYSKKRIVASTGIDMSLWQDTKLLFQGIYRYEFDFYNNPFNIIALQNQKLSYAFDKHQYYVSATYKQSIGSKHDVEFSHLIGKNQSLTTAKYAYKIKDGLEFNLKGQYISTINNNNILGQIRPKKHIYADISYYF